MMIGNNPAELSGYQYHLSQFEPVRFKTNFAFNLRRSFFEVRTWQPQYILIDDNFPSDQIRKFIRRVRKNVKTQAIPVALLKSSNRHLLISGIQDYFLKDNFNAERLYSAVRNSRNIRMAQVILYRSYKRGKRQFRKLRERLKNLF